MEPPPTGPLRFRYRALASSAIAAGNNHSVALKSDGTLYTWGKNANGQLGDGGTVSHSSPAALSGVGTVVGIGAGGDHSFVILSGGAMKAWGKNATGQVGDGTTSQRVNPTSVSGVSTAALAMGGNTFTLARLTTNTVVAWGDNADGELGDGTTTQRTSQVAVSSLSSVSTVAGGGYHSLALKSDGTVYSWGRNERPARRRDNHAASQPRADHSPVQRREHWCRCEPRGSRDELTERSGPGGATHMDRWETERRQPRVPLQSRLATQGSPGRRAHRYSHQQGEPTLPLRASRSPRPPRGPPSTTRPTEALQPPPRRCT